MQISFTNLFIFYAIYYEVNSKISEYKNNKNDKTALELNAQITNIDWSDSRKSQKSEFNDWKNIKNLNEIPQRIMDKKSEFKI